mmetsp:Transcript_131886/g.239816  ORF Transcript_131886/g.239816 Transcript_131886/m.239816 type:complete len:686 (+) Transcript_131886:33-2090(+)
MALSLLLQFCVLLALNSFCRLLAEGDVITKLNHGKYEAELVDGEDAAIAAQRATEEHGIFDAEVVLEVAKAYAEQMQEVEYKPPKDLLLRTGGAYSRRADEAIKKKSFPNAIADCLRALMRPGLDSTAADVFMKKLAHALLRMERIREMQQQEAFEEHAKYAKENAEAEALAKEWKVVLGEDEALWEMVESLNISRPADAAAEKAEIHGVDVTLVKQSGEKTEESSARLSVREGEDGSHASVQFCAVHGIHNHEQVLVMHDKLLEKGFDDPNHLKLDSIAAYLTRGESHESTMDFSAAAADYARGLKLDPKAPEEHHQKSELSSKLDRALKVMNASQLFSRLLHDQDYEGALAAARNIPMDSRSDAAQLKIAKAYSHLSKKKEAIASLTSLINRCDKSDSWKKDEPRTIASLLGAVLALQVGDIDKAKKMYQLVLRADPDQHYVNKRYKLLRSYMKMITDTEELVKASKNHDVLKAVQRLKSLLEQVVGAKAAVAAGTRLLLFECKSKSAMTFHDDAIEACNIAIKQFEDHDNPDPRRIAEAYAWRAEANMRDRSYDDAVADFQIALKKVPNSQEYEQKLNEAKEKQSNWNESEEQHDPRTREKMGHFYVNRPNEELLELPENVDELEREDKCGRLKTAFRKMSLRWHPDKAKGGKARAQRKSAELGEAKGLLELRWGCKRRGRR